MEKKLVCKKIYQVMCSYHIDESSWMLFCTNDLEYAKWYCVQANELNTHNHYINELPDPVNPVKWELIWECWWSPEWDLTEIDLIDYIEISPNPYTEIVDRVGKYCYRYMVKAESVKESVELMRQKIINFNKTLDK